MQGRFSLLEGPNVLEGVKELEQVIKEGIGSTDPTLSGVELSKLHTKLTISRVNTIRMATFKHLNASPGQYDSVLDKISGVQLRTILGPDLIVQTKLNLSIQLPGDEGSQLD